MKKNVVSVIIPVYNSQGYITKCVESVVNQSYKNIEVILINDGSKDNSLEVINKLAKKYKNIKIIDQKNQGVAKTRNRGIKEASGEYIMFIDNDDYIDQDYIKTYVHAIDSNDIVIGGYKRVSDSKTIFQVKLKATEWSKYMIMAPWAKLYKKEFLINNKIEFLSYPIGEDVYFNLIAYSKNPKIKIIDNIGYNWYFNQESVSNTTQRGLNKETDILKLIDNINKSYRLNDEYLNYYFNRYYIWYLLFSGRYSTSDEFMEEYNRIKLWFKENDIVNIINPFSKKLKGELLKNRLIVFIFMTLEKLYLLKLFSRVYCRGAR